MSTSINKACPLTDEIVSYMYGEIAGAAELEFETHLADCMVCTDEFAEASNARFSVYEWKKEAFDPSPTPHIAVPYGENIKPSSVAALTAAIRTWAEAFGIPVAVAAGLAVSIAAGVVLYGYFGNAERRSEANVAISDVPVPQVVLPDASTSPAEPPSEPVPLTVSSMRPERPVRRTPRELDRTVRSYAVDRRPAPQIRNVPVLTAYQETEDNSLRLADLFDEAGG